MKNFRKLYTIILVMVIFMSLMHFNINKIHAYECECTEILAGGFDIVPDNQGNFFIISYDENETTTIISYFDTSNDPPSLTKLNTSDSRGRPCSLNYKYITAKYSNEYLYISHLDSTGQNTIIEQYYFSSDLYKMASLNLSGIKLNSPQNIAIGINDTIFIIPNNNADKIIPYTMDGIIDGSNLIYGNDKIVAIATDISNNNLYALTNSKKILKYNINSGTLEFSNTSSIIDIDGLDENFKFLNDTTLVSSSGNIYNLGNNNFEVNSTSKITFENYPSCIAISGFDGTTVLAKVSDNVLNRFNISTGKATGKIDFGKRIFAISTSNNKTIVINESDTYKSINIISSSDIEEIPDTPVNPDPKPNPDPNPSDNEDDKIESSIHYIDYENHIISEIPIGTTLSELKSNLAYNGYTISLTDSKGNYKNSNSTKLGTGYIINFIKDGVKSISFTLIVKGDLTGTGTLTSRDISCMSNYLLGKSSLEGVYLKAADINGDGEVTAIDLLMMYKMMQK